MKIFSKINWVITWVAMAMLKFSLKYRITGENNFWLQPVQGNMPTIFNRIDYILSKCCDIKILHIGFADFPFTVEKISNQSLLHIQLKNVTKNLLGLDNDKITIAKYSEITKDKNVLYGDITLEYPPTAISFKPDIILLSEVLEHLSEPYKAIDILYNSFEDGTKILVTVPNYAALDSIISSLCKTEAIHPHHYWYFSPYTLRKLFDEKRFRLLDLNFGMYYLQNTRINAILKQYPFNGDCIMATFSIIKTTAND